MTFTATLLQKQGMSRGRLVVDENLLKLAPELQKRRFVVFVPKQGMHDEEIKHQLLSGRVLITNNPDDFRYDVPIMEFSMIDTTGVNKDSVFLAEMISRAWIDFELGSKHHFILKLQPDGKHQLTLPD